MTTLSVPESVDRVDLLWAIEQIKQLKAQYFRYMDERDWDAWGSLFTDDFFMCIADPDDDLVVEGRTPVVEFVRAAITPGISTHHGHMPEITIHAADSASGIWAMFDYVQTEPRPEGELALQGYGHYHETYRRVDGEWRISTLRLTRLRVDPAAALTR